MKAPRPAHVTPRSVAELASVVAAGLQVEQTSLAPDARVVTGATLRAQDVRPGDLFAALPGARAHGADFADQAAAAGAVALLTDEEGHRRAVAAGVALPTLVHPDPRAAIGPAAARVYGDPSTRLRVLGITGTSGKTTTCYLLDGGLRAAGVSTGLVGTVETRVAGERLKSAFTTPEAPDLQALFALMVERGVEHVSMEVSSHALSLGRVAGTEFAVGGFTNLSQDHLDFHLDLEDYFAAKARLFDGRARHEVVCVDGGWGTRLVTPDTITVATGADAAASWTVRDARALPTGEQTFVALGPDGVRLDLQIRLPGPFNIANALLAAACLHADGIPADAIAAGLSSVDVPGRMERVVEGQPFVAMVDYSHKPGAVAAVLDAARAQAEGRVLVVLGCGGERDTGKRPAMGEEAARRADLLVVTDDNPRGEDPTSIRSAMLAGALAVPRAQRGEIVEIGDRRAAITEAVARARPGDILVVAGKGHETGQQVGQVVLPFSDRDVLAEAVRARETEENR
ncbi:MULTISPECIES: UDP-N-acetylmuramoyl-L-alanyl-D-glutamate--2,6-diaminopimelate ligase [Actinoalloteichus]|uniref:UDP-N-acetylmuramoyl-L-alanyl-D-glutamate--2,6-diaminopimelate ligase n=1 Tax=Actinoalloteichus fjordicus TaxID=1612552 RepID=A0AAC9PRH9_9PSEU|nr:MULTISPECIES: UDP-N-acetylmuramoyl-L-alanyl-D-glutamate--2,6-diaminopimelate ligase [Actinoalloteichus]APU13987.1 UDP-N-acetylmuramoylalanyl-D-glutamate--2,6-diaminopimelate ligase [Actinoalloteichus fjordicus]APU19933.1 UDP-N-acetylmuramoylalanyl-D-glutamate--2,6-diaminopimelate ligase [Actinoalloteichus sp. GBA129-24]